MNVNNQHGYYKYLQLSSWHVAYWLITLAICPCSLVEDTGRVHAGRQVKRWAGTANYRTVTAKDTLGSEKCASKITQQTQ